MDRSSLAEDSEKSKHPSPIDFDKYLPWACLQLQVEATLNITKTEQGAYKSPFATDRTKAPKTAVKAKDENTDADSESKASLSSELTGNDVNIQTVYENDHLVQLKFKKNHNIPRVVLKIISLIIPFQPSLTTIKIDGGLKHGGLHELNKIVSVSKVTEIILDDTVLLEANYYILLDKNNPLKYLSLARCKINDMTVETITTRLLECSLSILNLTSNRITDVGASYIGEALRANRKLSYLNLAGNMISDIGATSILNSLMEFPLNPDEVTEMKARHFAYLRKKSDLAMKIFEELRTADNEKKVATKKSAKVTSASSKKSKGLEKEGSIKNLTSVYDLESILHDKAEDMAKSALGPFADAFISENTVNRDEVMYCLGNNALCYLSLAYNNLTYFSVKKLHDVVTTQEMLARNPRGLINVCIEGNNIPESCIELTQIDYMLQNGIATHKRSIVIKKKPVKLNTKDI